MQTGCDHAETLLCRHNGSLVLAFRLELKSRPKMGRRIAVVELDESFVRRGPMTVIEPKDVR